MIGLQLQLHFQFEVTSHMSNNLILQLCGFILIAYMEMQPPLWMQKPILS